MVTRRFRWIAIVLVAGSASCAPGPAEWIPARCAGSDARNLDRFTGTPVNCVLVRSYNAAFTREAAARHIAVLAVATSATDAVETARAAMRAKLAGVVLEGDFARETVARVRNVLAGAPLLELIPRAGIALSSPAHIIGTYQGVWPGIQVVHFGDGSITAGATSSAWIDSNSAWIRTARAWGNGMAWLGNRPPSSVIEVIPVERYLQAPMRKSPAAIGFWTSMKISAHGWTASMRRPGLIGSA